MAENMVADILRPVAEEIGKGIVAKVKSQFNYLCCFKKNIESMRAEAKKLEDDRGELKGRVDAASSGGEVIVPKVNTWLTATDEIELRIRKEIEDKIPNAENGGLNIKARYLLSKKVKEETKAMVKLRKEVSEFHTIANPAPPPAALPFSLGPRHELGSRKGMEDKIVEDLRSTLAPGSRKQMDGDIELLSQPKVNIVGIAGMGGLGKTIMAENIVTKLKNKGLVEEAVKVVVGRPANLLEIQDAIARQLGLEEFEKELEVRSRQLLSRLTNTKKVVILLDDIWEEIELEKLGIPKEGECVTVLTSRYKDLLNQMGAQVYSMDTLSMDESWSLFEYSVGKCADDRLPIAGEVVRECKGWPIGIVTIGKALKDRPERIWNGVLHKLKLFRTNHIEEAIKDSNNPLRQSYELLESEDAKCLFLLCSLFPEDYDISLEDLVLYSMGMEMFKGVQTLEDARCRVWEGVEKLKDCFLLLDVDGSNGNAVKMHDVIHDVAIVIALEEGLTDGQKGKWRSVFQNQGYESVDRFMESNFQSLSLLIIQGDWQWISRIIERMQELNVLSLTDMRFKKLPQLVKLGKKLQTLELNGCGLNDLSPVVGLSNLVILKCYRCWRIQELPVEIGSLIFLKLLDLSDCGNLGRIPRGVISKLVELQELKMLNSFKAWESSKVAEGNRKNVGITELESLRKLKCLEIQIQDVHLVEEEMLHFPELLKYKIYVGVKRINREMERNYDEKVMVLSGLPDDISFGNWIRGIVNTTQMLYLKGDGSRNLDLSQAHSTIKELKIEDSRMLKELVDTSTDRRELGVFPMLEYLTLVDLPNFNRLCGGRIREGSVSFNKLRRLTLKRLPALTQLWKITPNDDAFLQLETLEIYECEAMEQVFISDETGRISCSSITFPKLKQLRFGKMKNLTAFWKGTEIIEFPSLEHLYIKDSEQLKRLVVPSVHNCAKGSFDDADIENDKCASLLCAHKVKFDGLKKLILDNYTVSNIWCRQIPLCFFTILERLVISNSHDVRSLFSLSIAKNLVRLNFLKISSCENMRNLLRKEKNEEDEGKISDIRFPNLRTLEMHELSNLKSLGEGIESIEFSTLEKLVIRNCPKLMMGIIYDSTAESNEREEDGRRKHDCDCKCLHLFCPKLKRRVDSPMDTATATATATARNNREEDGDGQCNHEDGLQPLFCHKKIKLGHGLEFITIVGCDNIRSLFSSSMIENLASLKNLQIKNCKHMEKVIACEEENLDENSIRFPSLYQLKLTELPSLGMFCDGRCALEMSSLGDIKFVDCPRLEFLNLGSISTPTLYKMKLDQKIFDKEQLVDMEDLNSFLRKHLMSATEAGSSKAATTKLDEENSEDGITEIAEDNETDEDIMKLTRKTKPRIDEGDEIKKQKTKNKKQKLKAKTKNKN